MSDEARGRDAGAIWKDQPEERLTVDLEQIVKRRTEELDSSTRWEILMSVGAALLFIGVMAWRLRPAHDRLQQVGYAAAIAWVAICLYRFRRRIWRRPASPDAKAASGWEYYRRELEERRDHLRRAWLWHGPLFLACLMVIAMWMGGTISGYRGVRDVLPLVVLLAVWTGFGFWRRRRQANEIQREIDEIQVPG
jgi:CHASE2 domain-containing sensor protein